MMSNNLRVVMLILRVKKDAKKASFGLCVLFYRLV